MKTKKEIEEKLNRIDLLLTPEEEGVHIRTQIKIKLIHEKELLEWILE